MKLNNTESNQIERLLRCWFEPSAKHQSLCYVNRTVKRAEMLAQYERDVVSAVECKLDHWAETPRGRLALILLLDQMPYYLYSQVPPIFEQDVKAQLLAVDGIEAKMDEMLTPIQRVFFYLPLQKALDASLERLGIEAYSRLAEMIMRRSSVRRGHSSVQPSGSDLKCAHWHVRAV